MLEVANLSAGYEAEPVLDDVTLVVPDGEIVAILGPSGSGKTTLLRAIAGLLTPTSGSIRWNTRDLAAIPAHRRDFGLMFQDHALFGHRDVGANVAFGLRIRGWSTDEQARRTTKVLAQVGLEGFERRRINELSGGEQQRVALARALAPSPRLLMLDEPLASVDRERRDALAGELATLLRALGITTLLVTHDLDEAFSFAHHVVILDGGRVLQAGPSIEVWRQPATERAARFLGVVTVVDGIANGIHTQTPWGSIPTARHGPVRIGFRPSAICARATAALGAPSTAVSGTVESCSFRREHFSVTATTALGLVTGIADAPLNPGSSVSFSADLDAGIVLPA